MLFSLLAEFNLLLILKCSFHCDNDTTIFFRGLPHAHIAVWLDPRDAPKRPEDIDRFTCAELPDKTTSPELHKLVTTHMIHGPCGKDHVPSGSKGPPCTKKGECEKKFPKDYCQHTLHGESVSPQYRRRSPADGGQEAHFYSNYTKRNYKLGNQWVVPYNR